MGSAPAALGLMTGTSVKRFRRLHLMQHQPTDNSYQELLGLPLSQD